MERIYLTNSCKCLQSGAVQKGGSSCIHKPMEMTTSEIRTEQNDRQIQPLAGRETTGQSWQTLLFGRQGRAFQVSGKIILTLFRYFSRKPCLTEGICRRALVVHGLPKPEYSQLKKIKRHEPSICNKRTAGSHEDAHAGNEKKKDGGTRTCRQVPATGDDRAGTHLHPVEPDSGNQPPSRQEQAAGQTVQ